MNQDQITEVETWVMFPFSGRGTKKTPATSHYLEDEIKGNWEIKIYFLNKKTALQIQPLPSLFQDVQRELA